MCDVHRVNVLAECQMRLRMGRVILCVFVQKTRFEFCSASRLEKPQLFLIVQKVYKRRWRVALRETINHNAFSKLLRTSIYIVGIEWNKGNRWF